MPGGHRTTAALSLLDLGELARLRGDTERARALLEEVLERSRAAGVPWQVANTLTLLAHLARDEGDHGLARARYRESLALYGTLGNPGYTAMCLEGMAALASAEADHVRATCLLAHAAELRHRAGTPPPPNEQAAVDAVLSTARAALGDARFAAARERGAALTAEEGEELAFEAELTAPRAAGRAPARPGWPLTHQ